MNHRINSRVVAFVAVLAGVSAFAPTARAAISPTLSLDQSAGTKAGATLNLGLDLKFTDTGTDSPARSGDRPPAWPARRRIARRRFVSQGGQRLGYCVRGR